MEAMKIEISQGAINEAVRAIVDEDLPGAVRGAIETEAQLLIDSKVRERIGPVIDAALASGQFVTGRYTDSTTPLDVLVKSVVVRYLDERVYLYAKTSDKPSIRLARSTPNSSEPTRLEAFLRFTVERFCDEYLIQKLESTVSKFLDKRGGMEAVARQQMAQLLKEKFKL